MTAKELLIAANKAEKELRLIYKRQQHYAELATSIGVKLSGMPGAKSASSRVETGAVALVDLDNELTERANTYRKIVREADALIGKLKQDKFREVLVLRYLCDLSWKTIMEDMGYKDEKSVYRCHGYALKELQKFM